MFLLRLPRRSLYLYLHLFFITFCALRAFCAVAGLPPPPDLRAMIIGLYTFARACSAHYCSHHLITHLSLPALWFRFPSSFPPTHFTLRLPHTYALILPAAVTVHTYLLPHFYFIQPSLYCQLFLLFETLRLLRALPPLLVGLHLPVTWFNTPPRFGFIDSFCVRTTPAPCHSFTFLPCLDLFIHSSSV